MINKLFTNIYKKIEGNTRFERIWFLSKIEFKRRYNEDSLGVIWALLNPLFRMGVYYFAFSVIITSTIENFALYLISGLILWMFFSQSTKQSMIIFKRSKYLVENIRFNKKDLFFSSVLSSFYGFLFSMFAYFMLSIILGVEFNYNLLFFPLWISVLVLVILGINFLLSTISIFLSDMNQLWDLILLAGFWTAPIFFRGEAIAAKAPFLVYINPLSPLIINIRKSLLFAEPPDWHLGIYSIVYSTVIFIVGVTLFNKFSYKAIEKI